MVLYNAFDWEYLRKKLVKLPGVSASVAAEKPTRKEQDKVVTDLSKIFGDEPEIRVANPAAALSAKQGYAWHWTHRGFQMSSMYSIGPRKSRATRAGNGRQARTAEPRGNGASTLSLRAHAHGRIPRLPLSMSRYSHGVKK